MKRFKLKQVNEFVNLHKENPTEKTVKFVKILLLLCLTSILEFIGFFCMLFYVFAFWKALALTLIGISILKKYNLDVFYVLYHFKFRDDKEALDFWEKI